MANKKKVREEIAEALKNFDKTKIKKLRPGKAQSALSAGEICSASFGSSGLGQARSKSIRVREWIARKVKARMKRKKSFKV